METKPGSFLRGCRISRNTILREPRGITDSMIRFSVGMEAAEDLIEDLNNALENV
ncbi:MAG: PLP-dependent transferase [Desulfobacteria bacterium]